jgi:hypothetical protein
MKEACCTSKYWHHVWYHKDRKERLAESTIQASDVALLGLWLYSLCTLDTPLLTKMIVKIINRPISLYWIRILDGSTWDFIWTMTKDPQAIPHFQTKKKSRDVFNFFYGSKPKKFPLQISMWFIPITQSYMDIDALVKCKEIVCNRQHRWGELGGCWEQQSYS